MSSYEQRYIHLEKLSSKAVEGITIGECYIFPKLDGTNGVIWYEDGQVKGGSRNRVLLEDSDNAGFLNTFVKENKLRLQAFFEEYPNRTLYGEWLVPHTVKTYREEAWRRFYIFDVMEDGQFLHYDSYSKELKELGFDVIPPLVIITNPTTDQLWNQVNANTYMMKDGDFIGEGIVIKRYDYINPFGRHCWAKLVRPEFKDDHRELSTPNKIINKDGVEQCFVNQFFTADQVLKEKAKIINEKGSFEGRDIPRLLGIAYYEILRDNLIDYVNKKGVTIDFKLLKTLAYAKIKEFI